jgi:hypothetical protein
VIIDADHDPLITARAADTHEEAGVGLLIDEPVVFRAVAKRVVKNLGGPMARIDARVEEAAVVGIPDTAAARISDFIGQVGAGTKIAYPKRIKLRTLVVEGPEQPVVVA